MGGANKGKSYFTYSIEPGEHHVCVDQQSVSGKIRQAVSMDSFIADPGHVYYYQIKITIDKSYQPTRFSLDLVPLNADDGEYQAKLANLATPIPKK